MKNKRYCHKCRSKTPHTEHGFKHYNRREQCVQCHIEIWDGLNEK